jgi:hypothetical protein
MDVKDKQRAVVIFLPLEGSAGKEIVIRFGNVYGSAGYWRASVFRWIREVRRSKEGRPGRPYQHEADVAIRSVLQENPNASLRTIAETLLNMSITRGWLRRRSERFEGQVRRMRSNASSSGGPSWQQRWSVSSAILPGHIFNLNEVRI